MVTIGWLLKVHAVIKRMVVPVPAGITPLRVVSCRRTRGESVVRKRLAGFILEIQSFAFDHQRAVVHLRVYVPDVFPDDAHEEELQRSEEKHANGDGCYPNREVFPEHQLVCEVCRTSQHGEERPGKTRKRDHSQRDLRKLGDTEHCKIVERVKIVLCLAALSALLLIKNLGVRKTDFGNHAAEVWVGISKLANKVDDLAIVQSKAGKVFVSLDVVRKTIDQSIKHLSNQKHRRRFVALMLDGNDDGRSVLPLFEQ